MTEQWKPVLGYEDLYEVSNLGRVRSLDRVECVPDKNGVYHERIRKGRVLKPNYDGRGNYLHVSLRRSGSGISRNVHRMVAQAFVPNPDGYKEVNHKDEDKTNNRADNLEWCSHLYNNQYGTKADASKGERNSQAKITRETVLEIRSLFKDGDPVYGLTPLAKRYGLSVSHTCAIIKGNRWGWLK